MACAVQNESIGNSNVSRILAGAVFGGIWRDMAINSFIRHESQGFGFFADSTARAVIGGGRAEIGAVTGGSAGLGVRASRGRLAVRSTGDSGKSDTGVDSTGNSR